MAADEVLAAVAQDRGEVLLRLYGWQPETISISWWEETLKLSTCCSSLRCSFNPETIIIFRNM